MKKFTVKDFITYNNPCFSCGEKINLKIGHDHGTAELRPTVKPDYTVIDLRVTYTHTLQLWIFHKTNKIITSDGRGLADYLYNHNIYLQSQCSKCYTSIQSQFLEFNLDKGFIKPVGIKTEKLIMLDDDNMYTIYSSFEEEKSMVAVDRINKATPVAPTCFDLPLLPLSKFKTKERYLDKIKVYLTFS